MKKELLAPNGKPSNLTPEQYKLVRTAAFKNWFGNWEKDPESASKIVDENGEPMIVYHRSKTKFYEFLKDTQLVGWLGKGFYFSPNKDEFKEYGKTVIKTFLNIKKLFNVEGQSPSDIISEIKAINNNDKFDDNDVSVVLKENGYNGLKFNHWDRGVIISCFDSNQIKIADGTNTTFDSSNDDIRFDAGGETKYTTPDYLVMFLGK